MQMNSIVAFWEVDTQKWEFSDMKELYTFRGASDGDFAEFSCYEASCFFKANSLGEISTFESCDYNERL